MRRFDQSLLFDVLAESGGLSVPLMNELAGHIADFHAIAERRFDYGGATALTPSPQPGRRRSGLMLQTEKPSRPDAKALAPQQRAIPRSSIPPLGRTSVRHQHRYGHAAQERAGCPAEQELAGAGMPVGAHHQQVDAEVRRTR